jgi:hypothetical protein
MRAFEATVLRFDRRKTHGGSFVLLVDTERLGPLSLLPGDELRRLADVSVELLGSTAPPPHAAALT